MFWLVAEIVHGFTVDGFMAALIGSILYSILTLVTSWLLFSKRDSK
jgi:putative membrane protein